MRTLCLLAVLQAGLQDNFAEVQVSVVECPDLTEEPFQFPVKGKKSPAGALHACSIVCTVCLHIICICGTLGTGLRQVSLKG